MGVEIGIQEDEYDYSDMIAAIERERAHTLNSQGGMLLKALEPAQAVEVLEVARALHSRLHDPTEIGRAETLTHLAQAKTMLGDSASAGYLLEEALEIVERTGDLSQKFRISEAMQRCSNAAATSAEKAATTARDAALASEDAGQTATAYVRWCIAADWAQRTDDASLLDEALDAASRLEDALDAFDIHRPMLTLVRARRQLSKGEHQQALETLYAGCKVWQNVAAEMGSADVEQAMRKAHELHLLLTKVLVERANYEGALAVLESARAVAFAMETRGATNASELWPLPPDLANAGNVAGRIQARLADHEAILVPTLLPGLVGCFIVTSANVVFLKESVSDDGSALVADLNSLPEALDKKAGAAAIPDVVCALGNQMVAAIGDRRVVSVAPHSLLHVVPWRAVLRHLGATWAQLPAAIDFALHSWIMLSGTSHARVSSAVALGYGVAGNIDFANEALDFAVAWGDSCECEVAELENVRAALHRADVVHLSCHGIGFANDLAFDLADAAPRAEELVDSRGISADTVLLSVCSSGTYFMRAGDDPVGAAPMLLRHGARACLCTRFPIDARFAARLLPRLGKGLSTGTPLEEVLAQALQREELDGVSDFWSDLACVEIVRARPAGLYQRANDEV